MDGRKTVFWGGFDLFLKSQLWITEVRACKLDPPFTPAHLKVATYSDPPHPHLWNTDSLHFQLQGRHPAAHKHCAGDAAGRQTRPHVVHSLPNGLVQSKRLWAPVMRIITWGLRKQACDGGEGAAKRKSTPGILVWPPKMILRTTVSMSF